MSKMSCVGISSFSIFITLSYKSTSSASLRASFLFLLLQHVFWNPFFERGFRISRFSCFTRCFRQLAWTTAIAMENVDCTPCIVKPISIFSLFRQFFCLKVMVVHAAKWLLFSQEISLSYRQVSSGVYTFLRNSRTVLSFKLGNFNLNLIRPRCSQFRLYFPTT